MFKCIECACVAEHSTDFCIFLLGFQCDHTLAPTPSHITGYAFQKYTACSFIFLILRNENIIYSMCNKKLDLSC